MSNPGGRTPRYARFKTLLTSERGSATIKFDRDRRDGSLQVQ